MKYKCFLAVLFLTSCAQLTPEQKEERWKKVFIGYTACTDSPITLKKVQSMKNAFGNEVTRSYAFNCGTEKYACTLNYDINIYNWRYSCRSKISHTVSRN